MKKTKTNKWTKVDDFVDFLLSQCGTPGNEITMETELSVEFEGKTLKGVVDIPVVVVTLDELIEWVSDSLVNWKEDW
jgi:hypothetical protein